MLLPVSVRLYGARISGVLTWPYVESRYTDPAVPRPFTRLDDIVTAGLSDVLPEGASYN